MNINEIAKLAGVSRATVSRYLNDGYVSNEKKEKIKAVIEDTGYQPSSFAQTLRNRKTRCIGVIIPKIDSTSIGRIVKGISEILAEVDYRLLLACTNNNETEELKYLSLFKENNVDGIILLGTIFTPEHKKLMQQLTVPIVVLGQQIAGYSCIYHDDYGAARSITNLLCETAVQWGYIGVTDEDTAVGKHRKQGFLDSLAAYGQSISTDAIEYCDFTMDAGFEAARRLLERKPCIDSLLCATDSIAAGALKYLEEKGISLPDQIQIAGFGDSPIARVTSPSLTTVHFHYKTAGIEACRLLLEMLQNPGQPVTKEVKLGYNIVSSQSIRGCRS